MPERGSSADGACARSVVTAAIRGDTDAVRQVWAEHRRWVAAVLLAHKPRSADLDDLLQDVATTFVRMVGELRDEGALKPWLRTVAINQARLAGRTLKRRGVQASLEASAEARGLSRESVAGNGSQREAPEARVDPADESARILDLAQSLPEGYREPMLLRCVRGMSYRTIGELLGLPETTIETRIARGRRMLRELVEQHASGRARAAGDGDARASFGAKRERPAPNEGPMG